MNFNLVTGSYSPYRKPLNKPIFIHKESNHPKVIKLEVPRNAEKRLSDNSSNEKIFEKAKPPYLEALKTGWVSNTLFEPRVGNQILKSIAMESRSDMSGRLSARAGTLKRRKRNTIANVRPFIGIRPKK